MLKAKVYIDGANMFYTQKKLGWSFDWEKIKHLIEKDEEIIEWRYYVLEANDIVYLENIKANIIRT